MISQLLRGIFYPKFLPSSFINDYSICGWKVSVLNGGPAGKPIVLVRLDNENKIQFLSFDDLEKNFLSEGTYIKFAFANGYKLKKRESNWLHFEITLSEP